MLHAVRRRLADADRASSDRRAVATGSQALADRRRDCRRQGRRRAGARQATDAAKAIAAALSPASARRSCSATPPRSIPTRRSCWRWRTGSPSRPARRVGFLGEAANTVGALRRRRCRARRLNAGADARRSREGLRAAQRRAGARLRRPAARRCAALAGAEFVVALTPFKHRPRLRRRAAADRAVHRDRRAPSSTPKAACRASTASSSRSARRGRAGRCCACSATCSASPGFDFDTIEQVRAACLERRRHRRAPRQPDADA